MVTFINLPYYMFQNCFSLLFSVRQRLYFCKLCFSYKAALIMFGVISTLYSFIIYFCNRGPLLLTRSGSIRYVKTFLLFYAGLLIIAFPVNIQRSYTNLLFILFDFVDNAVRVIYKSDGIISASITYIICIWGISTVIYFIQNHFYKHQPQLLL